MKGGLSLVIIPGMLIKCFREGSFEQYQERSGMRWRGGRVSRKPGAGWGKQGLMQQTWPSSHVRPRRVGTLQADSTSHRGRRLCVTCSSKFVSKKMKPVIQVIHFCRPLALPGCRSGLVLGGVWQKRPWLRRAEVRAVGLMCWGGNTSYPTPPQGQGHCWE